MTAHSQTPLIVLAAGGTGGHMFPAKALAQELLERGRRVALITDRRGGGFGADLPQVETHHIRAAGFLGGDMIAKLRSLSQLGLGYLQARRILARLGPKVLVGFGGYAALPTMMAATHQRRRIVLHEQNAVAGRTNRLLARHAAVIATSFPAVQGLSPAEQARCVLTGNPVRGAIAALGHGPYPRAGDSEPLRLLVTGGSQGARVFNDIVPQAVARLPKDLRERLEISQQVRGDDLERVAAVYTELGLKPTLQAFFEDVPERLGAAHLVICRSGASTVAELAAAGRPAILVPYPFAADDHQSANAQALADGGGAWVMPQATLTADALAERLGSLLENPTALTRAADCARAFGQEASAKRLADLVLEAGSGMGGETTDRKEAAA